MSLRRVVQFFRLTWVFAWLALSTAAMASEYRGQVTFGGLPVPGTTVTVTATQGDKKVTAVTDDQGRYYFPDLADGTWTLEIRMTGFAPIKQEIAVAPNGPIGTFELKLMTLDQIHAEVKPVKADALPPLVATALPSPTPAAAAPAAGAAAAGKTPAANGKGAAPAKGTPTQVASGGAPDAPAPAPAQDPTAAQANDGFLINGSVNNAATSQFSLNQAFGNNRTGGRSLYNGNVFLRLDNSSLDAAQYSVTGVPAVKPQFNNFTLGLNFGGPLKIPHLMPRGPYFGLNYSRTQNSSVNTTPAKLPTGLDGSGNWNLSSLPNATIYVPSYLATVSPGCNSYLLGTGMTQAQINSGTATFANKTIPAACVSSQAKALLTLYPQTPNLSGNPLGYNYQLPLTTSTHADNVGISLQKQFGNKNNLNGRFNFQSQRISNPSIFGFLDSQNQIGMNTGINWNHRFTQRLSGNFGYNFSRQRGQTVPFFANKTNVALNAGITGGSTDPRYWGPPSLGFASSITGLSDGISSYNRNETNAVSVNFYWNKFRHNVQFGGDFRRLEFNYLTQANPYGSLNFTGAATADAVSGAGSDQADFLLGIPDTSGISFGNADKYLRQSTYDAFIDDDFRVNPEFSIHAGLRWEYGSPITEIKNRLVNLDIAQGFAAVTPVLASSPSGSLAGAGSSLVHPDYSRPEPRIGIAWRPISGSSLLVRSGYDVTNDTSVYQTAAYAMATQFPLSKSLSVANSALCPFNLASPFSALPCSTTSQSTFALDPHFRVGYVQTWNLSVQRDLPYSLQMVATYTGIKGTRGVQEYLPNSCPPGAGGVASPCTTATSGYRFRTSGGNLTREAGSMELRRRLRNGFQARLLYTYSKSLDDDFSLSGQGSVTSGQIAQDWQHPEAQRALSTSDQRHVLNFTAQYTTGMGLGGKALMSGWRGALYKEWTIQTAITAASGTPLTPIYAGAVASGTGIANTVRPNLIGSPFANLHSGYFINAAAYEAPVGTWGNARRDSIPGPYQFSMDANMNRTFRLHDRYTLDAQLNATNVLNHVVISGYNTSWIPTAPCSVGGGTCSVQTQSFGAPTGAKAMRAVSIQLRMRF